MEEEFLKVLFICLCFGVALVCRSYAVDKAAVNLLVMALAATALADLCLVILRNFVVGVAIFCVAQALHLRRYGGRLSPFLLILPFLVYVWQQDLLLSVALLYAQLFIMAAHAAIKAKTLPPTNRALILSGIALFALCDISVALDFMGFSGFGLFIWAFYAPSQMLLALSGLEVHNAKLLRRRK